MHSNSRYQNVPRRSGKDYRFRFRSAPRPRSVGFGCQLNPTEKPSSQRSREYVTGNLAHRQRKLCATRWHKIHHDACEGPLHERPQWTAAAALWECCPILCKREISRQAKRTAKGGGGTSSRSVLPRTVFAAETPLGL